MPPSSQRLNRTDFTRYFKLGTRRHTPHLTLIFVPNTKTKLAVVVSKKVAKKAHDRNRLRRRLYALLRELIPSEMVCIIVAKPAITHLTKSQFQAVVRAEIADVFTSR